MVNRSKSKGTAAETAVVLYLKATGFPYAERRALGGVNDKGDIAGVRGWVLEVKNCRRMDLAGWIDEARQEKENAGVEHFACIHKRVGKANPADWYVTLPLSIFVDLIR